MIILSDPGLTLSLELVSSLSLAFSPCPGCLCPQETSELVGLWWWPVPGEAVLWCFSLAMQKQPHTLAGPQPPAQLVSPSGTRQSQWRHPRAALSRTRLPVACQPGQAEGGGRTGRGGELLARWHWNRSCARLWQEHFFSGTSALCPYLATGPFISKQRRGGQTP